MLKTVTFGKNEDRLLRILMILLVPAYLLSFYLMELFIIPLLPLDLYTGVFMLGLAFLPPIIVIISLYTTLAMELISCR